MSIHNSKLREVHIIGGGLAGSEAAWQLARAGVRVLLSEMRPAQMTKAHKSGYLSELVCSNSLRGASLSNAVGLLKEELRRLDSLIMEAADHSKVPAGGALAVNRELFSLYIDNKLREHPLVSVRTEEIAELPPSSRDSPVIVASGPLTSLKLVQSIERLTGTESLAFFDAISPIILSESLDYSKLFFASRYGKGAGNEYLNVPLSEQQYYDFVEEISKADKFGGHDNVESDDVSRLRPFEGCMPIESIVERGKDTLAFGPLKPVGLRDPQSGRRPFAVLQLRREDAKGTMWNMVGMQTRMTHPEQRRVFCMLPGLENAEFVRLGSVHRNTFIESPKLLFPSLEFRTRPGLFFAGQITGVEGYVESTAGGLVAGINAARILRELKPLTFPKETAIGALMDYISDPSRKDFQPMNISFGLIEGYEDAQSQKKIPKDQKRLRCATRALEEIGAAKPQIPRISESETAS